MPRRSSGLVGPEARSALPRVEPALPPVAIHRVVAVPLARLPHMITPVVPPAPASSVSWNPSSIGVHVRTSSVPITRAHALATPDPEMAMSTSTPVVLVSIVIVVWSVAPVTFLNRICVVENRSSNSNP